MSISRETWTQMREDYIRGRGSLRTLAKRHGLNLGSVEKRARKDKWTALRSEYEAAQLAKLIPTPPPVLPPVPVAPDGAVSDEWMQARMQIYYQRNAELLDKTRTLLEMKLGDATNLGMEGLAKLTAALGGIVDAENKLLGLNSRRKEKRPYRQPVFLTPIPIDEPTPIADPIPTDEQSK